MSFPSLKLPKVIGHRGACGYALENTLASMRKAYELGIQWVEFDVMLTRDEQAIIMHDETLDRTTQGRGKVADVILAEVKKFSDGAVPTFAELLKFLADLNMHINVEIKPTAGKETITAQKTMEILQQHWPMDKSIPLISSAQKTALMAAYKIAPQLPYGFISDHWLDNWQQQLQSLNCISFHVNHQALTPEKVALVKQAEKYLLAYTVNDAARAKELFSWGVDAVFSDFPDRIANLSF